MLLLGSQAIHGALPDTRRVFGLVVAFSVGAQPGGVARSAGQHGRRLSVPHEAVVFQCLLASTALTPYNYRDTSTLPGGSVRFQRPFETLAPTLDGDVLLVLARAEASFTGGQLARLIPDASEDGVRRAAQRLATQGIVLMEKVGQAHNYTLNRDHLLADSVVAIAKARRRFEARIQDLVDTWDEQPEVLVLFGSAARGQMRSDSDIDLFVVGEGGEPWEDQLIELELSVQRWTGNDARILVMTSGEADSGIGSEPVLDDIVREGQVLWGPDGWLRQRRTGQRTTPADS